MTFKELQLLPQLLKAVDELGYTEPSPIQVAAIPPVAKGCDLIGCAQTGTGKTAAFAIPILQRLNSRVNKTHHPIRVLVLTPTRELALQIKESFDLYGKYLHFRRRGADPPGGGPAKGRGCAGGYAGAAQRPV